MQMSDSEVGLNRSQYDNHRSQQLLFNLNEHELIYNMCQKVENGFSINDLGTQNINLNEQTNNKVQSSHKIPTIRASKLEYFKPNRVKSRLPMSQKQEDLKDLQKAGGQKKK